MSNQLEHSPSTARCKETAFSGQQCGRPVHVAPHHVEDPVCIMHSRDPEKSNDEFQVEVERILKHAAKSKTLAVFDGFVFPPVSYYEKEFLPDCSFFKAAFSGRSYFARAHFHGGVRFVQTTFSEDASFHDAQFFYELDFTRAQCAKDALFAGVTFRGSVTFWGTEFNAWANFRGAKFLLNADFQYAKFLQKGDFQTSLFQDKVTFEGAHFFRANFFSTCLTQEVDFTRAHFLGSATFRETRLRRDNGDLPSLIFSHALMTSPDQIEFHQVDLSHALFYNCDVSKVDFGLVRWRRRGERERLKRRKWVIKHALSPRAIRLLPKRIKRWLAQWRRLPPTWMCLFEESVSLRSAWELEADAGDPNDRNYRLIAETYQQLRRNYDAKGDYWTAGHFHYGEMEMQRLNSRREAKMWRWLEQHLGLVALYRYASCYGEDYLRPLQWMLVVVLCFTLIVFPLTGLEWVGSNFSSHSLRGAYLMAALSTAGFQKEFGYAPSYPWGRLCALVEVLFTTTLGGLFALAIRRKFRRS